MVRISQVTGKLARLHSLLHVRPRLLIVGILGSGTMIVFPAATALVVIYIAVTLASVALMAWTGMIALAALAAAALIVPVVSIAAIFGVIAAVRGLRRLALPPCSVEIPVNQQSLRDTTAGSAESNALQQSLDEWETDGGPVALLRKRAAQRRVRRFDRHRAVYCPRPAGER